MVKSVIAAAALASAGAVTFQDAPGHRAIDGQYIIHLKKNFDANMLQSHVNKISSVLSEEDHKTRHVYSHIAKHGFVGYAAKLSPKGLRFLMEHDAVEYIEQDQVVSINDCLVQNNADWGIARTNQRGSFDKKDDTYHYTTGHTGKGVNAYIIDTGIYCENTEFTKKSVGSCSWGIDVVDGSEVDGNGHGTHCAGTVGGATYGVAKEVDLIAVRVLNSRGAGSNSDIVAGIDWVISDHEKSGKPSTANMSLGGSYSKSSNDAAESAVKAGVNMNVAAGNENQNACDTSPASAPLVNTVGATEIDDTRASYSNYGSCLDLFGPGTDITSAWIGNPTATNTISGTSMATPHVTGVTAKYLSETPNASTDDISARLVNDATKDVVKGADGGLFPSEENTSPNLLVYGYCS